MREWNLAASDPLALTLACDVRTGGNDYVNDQIWELTLGGGEPPALGLRTSYGLRARQVRLFPRFLMGEIAMSDPAGFAQAPLVQKTYPNYIQLTFAPFPGIDVMAEYWVPSSQSIAGRIQIANHRNTDCRLEMEWVVQLSSTEGQPMAVHEMTPAGMGAASVTVLSGQTGGLAPVVMLSGGPKIGSGLYPALALKMELAPGAVRQVTWAQAALGDRTASFDRARSLLEARWEAEVARLDVLNSGHVEIFTGDPNWDAAFMLAQKQAISLLVGPTPNLPSPSFVLSRQPDQGFSLRGDGNDYNHLWSGQLPLEACYLASLILPVAPELAQGFLRNFLATQDENGFIDWKPGLGGQRGKLLATPVLASLAWRIFEVTEQVSFLEETFNALVRFLAAWFSPEHDRDQDGIPEWDHPMQAGMEDHPIYSRWHAAGSPSGALGVDIRSSESPALCAMLFRECNALLRIAGRLGRQAEVADLETAAGRLREAVEAAWNDDRASYSDWDRDTHHTTRFDRIAEGRGSGRQVIQRRFEQPIRLFITVRTDESVRRRPLFFVHGSGSSGNARVERITDEQFRWLPGLGSMTGRYVYSHLGRIEVYDLEAEDQYSISNVGYDFQTIDNLLPLWAGIPSHERAEKWVEETLANPHRFWRLFGLPACPLPPEYGSSPTCDLVHLPWVSLVGEGLVAYGYRALAAELVMRLMNAVVLSLKKEAAFRRHYHAETGQGSGERNALEGLAPLGLFLDVLGVRLISPRRVALSGFNPFPWPVTVKYRGLTVLRQAEKSTVIFPDGQTVVVDDPAPRIVALEPTGGSPPVAEG